MIEIARTVRPVKDRASDSGNFSTGDELMQGHEVENRPFMDFRAEAAIVLLGDPGMGKTTEFEREASATNGRFITARDFLSFGVPDHAGEAIFIDGLDEVRAGTSDVRTPFDEIRKRLQELSCPPFRLSCREADWLSTDKDNLKAVSLDSRVTVLRLNPLTDKDINNFLKKQDKLPDPDEFKQKAKEHQLYEMMRNPQILDSLIVAVGTAETWPRSKAGVFNLAIGQMLREHNEEHAHAGPIGDIPEPRRRKAVEYLCALMLLADKPVFIQGEHDRSIGEDLPSVSSLEYKDSPALNAVIKSKLFKQQNNGFTYIHRSFAEYLCASCLQQRMDNHLPTERALPLARVLALLTGKDGVPVSALRGVYAWLTALSAEHRSLLMQRDSLGIVLYGDVSQFSLCERQELLDNLKDASKFMASPYSEIGNSENAFSGFCTKDNAEKLTGILRSKDRSKEHQWLTVCVLKAIMHGDDIQCADPLLDLVRDNSWYADLRENALETLISKNTESNILMQLLQDIQVGTVDDGDGRLVGILLDELYPRIVTAHTVFDYFYPLGKYSAISIYEYFWHKKLSQKSDDEIVPVLLDKMAQKPIVFNEGVSNYHIREMIVEFLFRGLYIAGENVEITRLASWLELGIDEWGMSRIGSQQEKYKQIQEWLSVRPEVQKKILKFFIERHIQEGRPSNELWRSIDHAWGSFQGATPPPDIAAWYLDKSVEYIDSPLAEGLFRMAINHDQNNKLTERIQSLSTKFPFIREGIHRIESEKEAFKSGQQEYEANREVIREKQESERTDFIVRLQENIRDIREGQAAPHLYYQLGMAYFGFYVNFQGDSPKERLCSYFNDDQLVDNLLIGLRNTVQRSDIPEYTDVLNLAVNDRVHRLSFALAAGIDEMTRNDPAIICTLDTETLKTALAIRLSYFWGSSFGWYDYILSHEPNLAASVIIDYISKLFNNGREFATLASSLAYDSIYSHVAKLAAMPVLRRYPLRSNKKQLITLRHLLIAAWLYDRDNLPSLIKQKLQYKCLPVSQRVHWLTMGIFLDPEAYFNDLEACVSNHPRRLGHLVSFVPHRHGGPNLLDELPDKALHKLAQIIASGCTRIDIEWSGPATPETIASDLIVEIINILATRTTESASSIFRQMLEDKTLENLHYQISCRSHDQWARRREAEFSHPGLSDVEAALRNEKPCNAADVAATTYQALLKLAEKIRHANTNDYEQYWAIEYKGHSKEFSRPKREEDCRNVFLSSLGPELLNYGLSAEPEGTYADEKRSDIKVMLGNRNDINIPIEIKCSYSQDIWYAIHDQLIPKYTRDPGTSGYGIYLVFWFGESKMTPPPEGTKPKTAQELETRLRERLKDDREQRLISIAVIDCTPPE